MDISILDKPALALISLQDDIKKAIDAIYVSAKEWEDEPTKISRLVRIRVRKSTLGYKSGDKIVLCFTVDECLDLVVGITYRDIMYSKVCDFMGIPSVSPAAIKLEPYSSNFMREVV